PRTTPRFTFTTRCGGSGNGWAWRSRDEHGLRGAGSAAVRAPPRRAVRRGVAGAGCASVGVCALPHGGLGPRRRAGGGGAAAGEHSRAGGPPLAPDRRGASADSPEERLEGPRGAGGGRRRGG